MMEKKTVSQQEINKIPNLPHGEGTIVLSKDGTKLIYAKNVSGKRVYTYGMTVKEVISKMKQKDKLLSETIFQADKTTLSEAIQKWLNNHKVPFLKPSSYDRIECSFKNQINPYAIGDIRYRQITSDDILNHINFLRKKDLSYSTVKKCYDLLNEFFQIEFIRNPIDNPMLTVKLPKKDISFKEAKQIQFFEEDDIKKFESEATRLLKTHNIPKYALGHVFVAMIFLGVRAGEMIALKWSDIDFTKCAISINKTIERVINREYDEKSPDSMKEKGVNKYIDVVGATKNYSNRIIVMNDKVVELLLTHKKYSAYTEPDDYVIAVKNGGCNNISNMTKRLKFIESNAEMRVKDTGLHVLRHTCASLYFRRGIRTEIIAAHLGHSVDICQTTYLHFVEEQMKNAASKIINLNVDLCQ